MFKKLSVLALAMIISLSITACNSKENKANDESNTKVTTADDSKEKETLFCLFRGRFKETNGWNSKKIWERK